LFEVELTGEGGITNNSFPQASRVGFEPINSITLNLQRLGTPNDLTAVKWQAIEFVSGVVEQRGKASFLSADLIVNIPVGAVNPSQSFVLISVATISSGQNADEEWTVMTVTEKYSHLCPLCHTRGVETLKFQVPVEAIWKQNPLSPSQVFTPQAIKSGGGGNRTHVRKAWLRTLYRLIRSFSSRLKPYRTAGRLQASPCVISSPRAETPPEDHPVWLDA